MKTILLLLLCSYQVLAQDIKIKINEKAYPIDFKNVIKIPGKERTLNVEISTESQIEYLLQNHDTSWTSINSKSVFSYNNLPGGVYYLKIKQKEKVLGQIKLDVAMPFFRTWYFLASIYFFGAMILGMIIYFFLLYKFRQQAKLQKVRNNIAADLHDDVGATLTSIGFFGELIRQKIINRAEPSEILPLLSKVIDSSKESVETMRGVVWTINPNNDLAQDFFERLKYYANEMLSTKGVELNFEMEGVGQQELEIEVQRNLFLFFKEAINNILKHAKAKTAAVTIKMENGKFWMQIADDGIGFDTNESFDGHGLGSLRKRIENLNGTLKINSEINKGTELEVTVFLP